MVKLLTFRGDSAILSDRTTVEFPRSCHVEFLPRDPRYDYSCGRWRLTLTHDDGWRYYVTLPEESTFGEVDRARLRLVDAESTRAKHLARKPAEA